jgi:cell division transport system permease protein
MAEPRAAARSPGAALRRTRGRDPLGLRRVLSDRLLPSLVAAMALLAALALAGASGAAALAARWEGGVATALTVQLPPGAEPQLERALAALRALPDVADARAIDRARLAGLLRPWLGAASSELPALPTVLELRLRGLPADPAALAGRIAAAVPGATVETYGVWVARLVALSRSLQTMALAALLLVAGIATAVVTVAVRAGIAARRDSIAVLHGFGATDGDIAGRFASRVAALVGFGALAGTVLALPLLAGFADLAAPLLGRAPATSLLSLPWDGLPWLQLALLPPAAAGIGWLTAQATLRLWLRHLP